MPQRPWPRAYDADSGGRVVRYAEITEEVRAGADFGGGRECLPHALFILHDEQDTGGFFLITLLDARGSFGGDTWLPTLEDALGQAEFQYAGLVWTDAAAFDQG